MKLTKDWLKILLIAALSIGLGVYSRTSPRIHGVRGTVLAVDGGYALISKRMDLEPEDLSLSEEDWLRGNYELIIAGPIQGLEAGQQVKVTVNEVDRDQYPVQATVKDFRIIN